LSQIVTTLNQVNLLNWLSKFN